MESWRLREKILDMFDLTTGGRIIFSVMCVGGVSKDMDSGMLKAIKDTVDDMEKDFRPIMETFLKDYFGLRPTERAGRPHKGQGYAPWGRRAHASGQRRKL